MKLEALSHFLSLFSIIRNKEYNRRMINFSGFTHLNVYNSAKIVQLQSKSPKWLKLNVSLKYELSDSYFIDKSLRYSLVPLRPKSMVHVQIMTVIHMFVRADHCFVKFSLKELKNSKITQYSSINWLC